MALINDDAATRPLPRVFAAIALLATLLSACRSEPTSEAAPSGSLSGAAAGYNVVVISADTLRADRLGSYGYVERETSPQLDALMSQGMRFAQAQAPRGSTWPSLASVLTGLYPSGHGVIYNGYSFADDQPTLPLLLRQNGYQTAAFLSNMCQANHQGWDAFDCAGGVDGRVNRRTSEWLAERDMSRPFLLWTHFFGAHSPYYNGGDRARRLDPAYQGFLEPKKHALDRVMTEPVALDEADLRHLDALYDAAVIGTDGHIGRLLQSLREAGALERTVIVFLADHGEDLYQHHRYLYHSCSVYQSSLHVPLAFVAPGLVNSGAVNQQVELVDVLPTLLDLLGLTPPSCVHGSSLVPYLERPDRGGSGKAAFGEYGDTKIRTVVRNGWKLVHNPDALHPECIADVAPGFYALEPLELYDLGSDPAEQSNLAEADADQVQSLRQALEQRYAKLCHPSTSQREQDIPDEVRKRLEALGYVTN